jgi:hypothetical protein
MKCIPYFIQVVSGIEELVEEWGFTVTETGWRAKKPHFILHYTESGLKIKVSLIMPRSIQAGKIKQ